MEVQTRFSGDVKKPYSQICCQSCWEAQKEKCVCRCGGLYHGLGIKKEVGEMEFILSLKEEEPFRKQIKDFTCRFCGNDLEGEAIRGYEPHGAGWKVLNHKELCWLYIRCAKCGYDWALWKLGVAREALDETPDHS